MLENISQIIIGNIRADKTIVDSSKEPSFRVLDTYIGLARYGDSINIQSNIITSTAMIIVATMLQLAVKEFLRFRNSFSFILSIS